MEIHHHIQKPVLITGVAGFIGAAIAEALLQQNIPVTGVDDLTDQYDPAIKMARIKKLAKYPAFQFYKLDLSLEHALAVLDPAAYGLALHFAAATGIRGKDPLLYQQHNVIATAELLKWMESEPNMDLIFSSSSSVYGDAQDGCFSESGPVNPVSAYAKSKLACERMICADAEESGRKAAILRLFNVYGPDMRPDLAIPIFIEAMTSGNKIIFYGGPEVKRDFTHIKDVVQAVQLAADWLRRQPAQICETFNIGTGHPVTLKELCDNLSQELGLEYDYEVRAAFEGEMRATCADVRKAGEILGFSGRADRTGDHIDLHGLL